MKRLTREIDLETSRPWEHSCYREITTSDIHIPLDLTEEILKKLPVKSLMRFQCVSKQWSSIISSRQDFIDSIMARSLTHPRSDNLHFIFHHCSSEPFFSFSSTYSHKDHAVLMHRDTLADGFTYQYVRGLICCSSVHTDSVTIYNPTTRQSVSLPEVEYQFGHSLHTSHLNYYFGYDPVLNQYKVMCVMYTFQEPGPVCVCQVLTLGDPMKQWRKIQGVVNHTPVFRGVHINGTIYYRGRAHSLTKYDGQIMILSFNVMTQRFDRVDAPEEVTDLSRYPELVDYKGKLGCLCSSLGSEMWVMENAEKQEWSRTIFSLPRCPFKGLLCTHFSGVTLSGEIFILQFMYEVDEPLYVYFYDPKQNSFRRINIQGTTPLRAPMFIIGVPDHVENTVRF